MCGHSLFARRNAEGGDAAVPRVEPVVESGSRTRELAEAPAGVRRREAQPDVVETERVDLDPFQERCAVGSSEVSTSLRNSSISFGHS